MSVAMSVPREGGPWTLDDLEDIPDDANRYEIVDGSLVVNPPRFVQHALATERLRRALDRQAPPEFLVIAVGVGVVISQHTVLIPDLVVVPADAVDRKVEFFDPADVHLVAEVLSPSSRRYDQVFKRHEYATCGIGQYWIVDPRERAITVLTGEGYRDERVYRPGAMLRAELPYPMQLDPTDII